MRPILFHEANKMLTKPENVSKDVCGDLYVFSNGSECVSKWKLSFIDRLRALLFGTVWLCVLSGDSQPAVWMEARRTVFVKGPAPKEKEPPEVIGEIVTERGDM